LPSVESHEAEKSTSRADDVFGPHVVIDNGREEGGVCKAERAALGALEELEVSPVSLSKPLPLMLGVPIAGDAQGVNW
jgi:hypothetical protein